jgi:glycerophosphoryl diester phosphodiesterase
VPGLIDAFFDFNRVVAIAHRGGARLRPENTLLAFDHALALGVDGLECDVHLSRDGEVVVIHDATLDRTTDGSGEIEAHTADELARLDAGHHFGAAAGHPYRGRAGGVPTLVEVLDRYREVPVVIEIKGRRPEVSEAVVEVVRGLDAADRVFLAGFDQGVLDEARRQAPEIVTSAAFDEARSLVAALRDGQRPGTGDHSFRLFQLPFRLDGREQFDAVVVRAAREAGFPVQAWIVDQPDDMRRLIGWGVTGLISDRPDLAVQVRDGL